MKILSKSCESYQTFLKDKYRPPSQGGNTRAWHQHVLTIDGEKYSFLALGAQKWVFANDTVSFDWEWDKTERYRNVLVKSLVTKAKHGNPVVRGNRGSKSWRTAEARMPASQREQRD